MEAIEISDEFIKLGQALKLAGLVSSGVEAKIVIQNGEVTVMGRLIQDADVNCIRRIIFAIKGRKLQ